MDESSRTICKIQQSDAKRDGSRLSTRYVYEFENGQQAVVEISGQYRDLNCDHTHGGVEVTQIKVDGNPVSFDRTKYRYEFLCKSDVPVAVRQFEMLASQARIDKYEKMVFESIARRD